MALLLYVVAIGQAVLIGGMSLESRGGGNWNHDGRYPLSELDEGNGGTVLPTFIGMSWDGNLAVPVGEPLCSRVGLDLGYGILVPAYERGISG
jgi:hypothetical protein